MARWSLMIGWLLVCFALPAHAEVSDKIVTLPSVWRTGIVGGLATAAAADRSAGGGFAAVLLFGFFCLGVILELHDPWVGPAIIKEQGESYRLAAYAAPVLVVAGWVTGTFSRRRWLRRESIPL